MAKIYLILYHQIWNSITNITITYIPDNCAAYYSINDFLLGFIFTNMISLHWCIGSLSCRIAKLFFLKFLYYEKATNFCESSPYFWLYVRWRFRKNCSNSCHDNILKNCKLQQLFEVFYWFFFNENHIIFREGVFNLAGYLPDYCLKPELGPKMYIAYGSALYSNKGSTNLHIDMSDAVNYLVYVGFPSDGNAEENAKEVFKVQ